jgi:hypothetical protein
MISTIQALQKYLLKGADGFDELMMTSPGCTREKIRELKKALPDIPDSYTKWVEAVTLNGIVVGYFSVSTCSYHSNDIVANLIEGNRAGVMFCEQMQKYHLYAIGNTSNFGIFVATASSPHKEGEIIAIDENIYAEKYNAEQWIYRLAKDFEQFLIIAGNVNQLHREIKKDDSNYDEKKEEFLERLKILGVAEEYHKSWLLFF